MRPSPLRIAENQSAKVRVRTEDGASIVELAIALGLTSILFVMSVPIISTILNTSTEVTNTYGNVNPVLAMQTGLERLIRSAVAPGPISSAGIPSPSFLTSSVSPTSMTFFTNVGNANGPAEIHAYCNTAVGVTTQCATPAQAAALTPHQLPTLTVTETLPDTGSCPFAAGSTKTCTYLNNAPMSLFTLPNLSNGTLGVAPFSFELSVRNASSPNTNTLVPQTSSSCTSQPCFIAQSGVNGASTSTINTTMSGVAQAQETGYAMFAVCIAGTATTPLGDCPSAEINSLNLDFRVSGGTGVTKGGQGEYSTIVYMLSPQSSTFDPSVG